MSAANGLCALHFWLPIIMLVATSDTALGQTALCKDGIVSGAIPTIKRSPTSFVTLPACCQEKGFGTSDRELTECYDKGFSTEPPFHFDLSKLSGCSGDQCTVCDQCTGPLRVSVDSFSIEGLRYDSKKGHLTVNVHAELHWADPRLDHTMITDIHRTWKPALKVLAQKVNETEREDLLTEETARILDTISEERKEKATVYKQRADASEGYAWMVRTSKVVCKSLNLEGDCDLKNLKSCGVTERLNEVIKFNIAGSNFLRFPFDRHKLRMQFFFTDPYKSIPYEAHEEWGIKTPLVPDWHFEKEGESKEFENADGTKIMLHHSLYESLHKIHVSEFNAEWSVHVDPTHDGGRLIVDVKLTRAATKFAVRYVIPILFMTYATTVTSWLKMPALVHPRNFICIISLLTGVTLLNGSTDASPGISSQISWFDKVSICSILTSFIALVQGIVIYVLHSRGHAHLSDAIDRVWRRSYSLFYTCLIFEITVWDLADIPRWSGALVIGLLIIAFVFAWVGYWVRIELVRHREAVASGLYEVVEDKSEVNRKGADINNECDLPITPSTPA
eukprot:CAMPEP_0172010988 /NCGR_PEP_ID=MMETSP1041-20130122/8039_1 /TAXON_ID=464988 /ORGANISM="Hemiselmis andersenii, Strain CCMP439" /LENGTH=561 /DNA_ID=CAMNT_0012665417 /DNA_START=237 /DNA_END=1918 /DNA_ORIENTATION=-